MSALVPQQQPSAIVKMGEVLARVSRAPSLPLAPAGYPRTMIIVRLLSGASEADALLAHLIALPSSVAPAVVHCGGPAGPSFKAHDEATVLRLETDDPDLVAKVIDFREINERRHVIALFDPECLRGALQVVDDLALLRYPIDILFVTSRSETTPKFVSRLEEAGHRVIRAHKASLRREDLTDVLVYPAVSPQLEDAYGEGKMTLRQIVSGSSLGMQLAFERNLTAFAQSLAGILHG